MMFVESNRGRRGVAPFALGVTMLCSLAGCHGQEAKETPKGPPPSIQDQAADIRNNPTLTPAQKSLAMQNLRARQLRQGASGTTGSN